MTSVTPTQAMEVATSLCDSELRMILLIGQLVAEPPMRLDQFRAQLLAQPVDQNFDHVGVAIKILLIQVFRQFSFGYNTVFMPHEMGQCPEFERG